MVLYCVAGGKEEMEREEEYAWGAQEPCPQ